VKLELDDQERRTVGRALAERKALLIETTGDMTQTRAARRSALLELAVIVSVQRKLLTHSFGVRELVVAAGKWAS
jgi:hypothetical protein